MAEETVRIQLLEGGKVPVRGSEEAAGYDLFANQDGVVEPYKRLLIKTGVLIELKKGTYGRIAPRSGLAYTYGIDVMAGVIDSDYRGEIGVILYNTDGNEFNVRKGDRIAQLIITQISTPPLEVVDSISFSERGEGGYGSTGK